MQYTLIKPSSSFFLLRSSSANRRYSCPRSHGGGSFTVLVSHSSLERCSFPTPETLVLPLILKMVNATKGVFITCDIPMAQLIINFNASQPASQKFIIHVLDSTHLFVQPYAIDMIKSHITEFRDQISYEKPT